MKIFNWIVLAVLMSTTPVFANVDVSTPSNGATVGPSVHYVASGSANGCAKGVAAMGIYIDNHLTYTVHGASLNHSLSFQPGRYHTVVEEWDYCGHATFTSIDIQVGGATGVSVRSPAENSTVVSPVNYVATATAASCPKGVAAMGVYVDNHLIRTVQGAQLHTQVALNPGPEHTVVEEWDYCGGAQFTTVNLTVGSSQSGVSSVEVSCNPSAVEVRGTSQCRASVQGTGRYSSAVKWSASDGAVNSSGLFTAPASAGDVSVTAISLQDTNKSGTATIAVQPPVSQSKHVILVMEENQSYATVVGNIASWPNLNDLIGSGALATNYYASTHPSIGNYFALTTGQVLTNNDNSTTVWNVDNIARRMLAAGVSFKIYAEGISRGYVGGNTGLYLIRHEPFAMLSDIADNPQVAARTIWPMTQFATDVANGTLPEFSYIVPDIEDDAHNGTPHQADVWLQSNVVLPLSNSAAFKPEGDGLLLVDFDEAADSDTRYGGGRVAAVLWGPLAKAGYVQSSNTVYQHPSMLRTIMETLGLPDPPGAAANAPSMGEFLR